MITKPRCGSASGRTILLVDDSLKEKHLRAIMLNTHGYDVEAVSDIDDAYRFSQAKHPDLVLLALSKDSEGESTLWERISTCFAWRSFLFMPGHTRQNRDGPWLRFQPRSALWGLARCGAM